MRTRTTKQTKSPATKSEESSECVASLPPSSTNPPMLFILPQKRSLDAKILSLPNPATGKANRYFIDPESGIHEFTSIAAPRQNPTSWLLVPEQQAAVTNGDAEASSVSNQTGLSLEQPTLFVATPVDPLFMLLPTLLSDGGAGGKQLFLTLDDHLDNIPESNKALAEVLRIHAISARLSSRLSIVCDKVEAGDESMFRVNLGKVAVEILNIAKRIVERGLPASMEQKLIEEIIQEPVSLVRQLSTADEEQSATQGTDGVETTADSQSLSQVDNQPSLVSASSSFATDADASQITGVSTPATSIGETSQEMKVSDALSPIRHLQRLRIALDFLLASYIPATSHKGLSAFWDGADATVDFKPLKAHMERIAEMKKEAHTLRSLSDNISRKRRVDDDEAEEIRAEKKRKKDEDEAKKKAQSRAIKQLAKTDTSGMKKLSSFFTKGPAKKAKP